jgi:hypothetical protein
MDMLKKILDVLPFNGSKMKIGVILGLAAILQKFVPQLDLVELVKSLLGQNLDIFAVLTILIGAAHKLVKPDDIE